MMSRREAVVREVLARCAAAVSPVAVLRQPTTPIDRAASPAVIVAVESDTLEALANDRQQRVLTLRITALSRHPSDPWAESDDLLCRVHAALLAEQTLGGLSLALQLADTDFDTEDADAQAVALPATYRITYRTPITDLRQGG